MNIDIVVLLILLLPLAGAAINGLVGLFVPSWRKQEKLIGGLATALVFIPFSLGLHLFMTAHHGEPHIATYFTWMAAGDFSVAFAYRIDALSLLMLLIVTGVGSLIHLYATGYMHGDSGYWRFLPTSTCSSSPCST